MKRWLLPFLLTLAALPLQAAPIIITSGEHDGFTRLVITLPEAQDWSLGRMEDGYRLSLPDATPDIDLSRVKERIGHTRLAEVTQLAGSADLRIVAACQCHATAFAFRPNIIVVDVKSGPPPANSPFETPTIGPEKAEDAKLEPPHVSGLALEWNRHSQQPPSPKVSPPLLQHEDLGRNLARQIGTAATAGLIELIPINEGETPDLPQITLRSAPNIDVWVGDQAPPNLLQPECPRPDTVEVDTWLAQPISAAELPRELAQLLTSETDQPDPAQLEAAAKLYLYFGFGAEARQILSHPPQKRQDLTFFAAIGLIMDGEPVGSNPFSGMENCRSAIALWSVLARPQLRQDEPIAAEEIYQAFSALPAHLRALLAGPLMDRLREQGNDRIADRLRAMAERDMGPQSAEFDLALGRLQVSTDEPDLARTAFEKASAAPGPAEAEALIALVRLSLDAGTEISAARLQNIAALEAQFSSQPLGEKLREAQVIAYALTGEFAPSAKILPQASGAAPAFWQLLAEHGKPSDILNLAFTPPPQAILQTSPNQRARIAQHLADLGFAQQAMIWLTLDTAVKDMEEPQRIALAETFLALHQPKDALTTLAGAGPAAADLRARALIALDRKGEAASTLAGQPSSEAMLHLHRREGDWAKVAETDTAPWSTAAKEELRPLDVPQGMITLAAAKDALSRAGESEVAISNLLEATEMSAATAEGGGQ